MDYRFTNVLGAPYRGGNLVLVGKDLLSPVGNRVTKVRPQTDGFRRPLWTWSRGRSHELEVSRGAEEVADHDRKRETMRRWIS